MKRLIGLLLLCWLAAARAEIAVNDDAGQAVRLAQPIGASGPSSARTICPTDRFSGGRASI
jgi:hypothetical protein